MKKIIITLDGNPGSGKTTVLEHFKQNKSILCIDELLPGNPDSDTNLTFINILVSDVLKSTLARFSNKKIVLMDRYYHSTVAYEYGSGIEKFRSRFYVNIYDFILKTNILVKPTHSIFCYVSPAKSVSRKKLNRPWSNPLFLERMNEYYISQKDMLLVDCNVNIPVLKKSVYNIINEEKGR